MIRLIRRCFRRTRRRLQLYAALLSLLQLIFPQHVAAGTSEQVEQHLLTAAQIVGAGSVIRAADAQLLPLAPPVPARSARRVMATAYSSSLEETDSDPLTTASGAKVRDGVIAANGLPFGTKLRIPEVYGEKVFTVLDRMHPRYGRNYIDIWMPSKQLARQWGVRSVRVEIL